MYCDALPRCKPRSHQTPQMVHVSNGAKKILDVACTSTADSFIKNKKGFRFCSNPKATTDLGSGVLSADCGLPTLELEVFRRQIQQCTSWR